jgi:alpha-tubulin suppressor-like RCC1 family protein
MPIIFHTYQNLGVFATTRASFVGSNHVGQSLLGSPYMFTPVPFLTNDVISASSSDDRNAYVKSDGTLWVINDVHYQASLPPETFDPNAPIRVGTASNWVSVNCGKAKTFAINSLGELYAWGSNGEGSLGVGSTDANVNVPTKVSGLYKSVYSSRTTNFTLAINTSNAVVAWGSNTYYQVNGTATPSFNYPVTTTLTGAAKVTCGYAHCVALLNNGYVYCWGNNVAGQVGNGVKSSKVATPHQALNVGVGATQIAAGSFNTMAITTSGSLYVWGKNDQYELGDNTTTDRLSPSLLSSGWSQVYNGYYNSKVGRKTDGSLWAWGMSGDNHGLLGNYLPTPTVPLALNFGTTKSIFSESFTTVCYLKDTVTGAISVYGYDTTQAGVVSKVPYNVKTMVDMPLPETATFNNNGLYGENLAAIDGNIVRLWGDNTNKTNSSDNTFVTATPVIAALPAPVVETAIGRNFTLFRLSDGRLYAAGGNAVGQLGQGHTNVVSGFVQIAGTWTAIAAGASHAMGIRTNGDLYGWGSNSAGQMGLGDNANRLSPTYTNSQAVSVSCGWDHTVFLRSNGEVQQTGFNAYGQLGLGDNMTRNSWTTPNVPGSLAITKVRATNYGTLILRGSTGQIYAVGKGKLVGDGTTTDSLVFKQVPGFWKDISSGYGSFFAYDANNQLFTWGTSTNGAIGSSVNATPTMIENGPYTNAIASSGSTILIR